MNDSGSAFLIVDDEPDMCWALQHILKGRGFLSRIASNAGDALKLMESGRFRLAFLDAKLPDMEGLELARRIREVAPTTLIVMVSGYFYKDDLAIQKAFEDGLISGFISKPFLNDEILQEVRRITSA